MLERTILGDSMPAGADLDAQLGLGVDVSRLRRDDDRLAGADQRVRELAEEEGSGRQLVSELRRVLRVVSSDADDLHSGDFAVVR